MRVRGSVLRSAARFPCLLAAAALACACSRSALRDITPAAGAAGSGAIPCPRCDDGLFCNGVERCDPVTNACLPGQAAACDDGDECTIDSCDEASDRCAHMRTPRDADHDGFDACDHDCNDLDPAIHPGADEICDSIDSDCDGRADEGLLSECGDCRPTCQMRFLPARGDVWHPTADNSEAVAVDGPGGPLVLSADTRQRFDAWIANFVDGKVTKLDTRDGRQLARYDSVLADGRNGAEPPDEECDRDTLSNNTGGNCPSRTAVDLDGSVYVANRAFGNQGTVTKIAGFEQDCIDRNGDGEIQTSRDVNGNGQIDQFSDGEFLGQDDECLLWTVDAGGIDGIPRALAIAPDGSVWVGLHGESRVLQLDPQSGKVLQQVAVPGFKPYGAAIDRDGRMWLVEALSGQIVSVDTTTGKAGKSIAAPAPQDGCPSSYGIAIDSAGRVWIAGFTCPFAFGFDPKQGEWTSVALPDSGITRGIAADDRGRVFVASSHAWIHIDPRSIFGFIEASDPITRLSVFNADGSGGVRIFGTASDPLPGQGAIGVGLDNDHRAWLINQDTGSATRVDVDSGEIKHFGAGDLPYTYSDFTGFALRRITAASGFIRGVLNGCKQGPSEWEQLDIDADIPAGARIQIRLRTANASTELGAAHWLGPWDSASGSLDLRQAPGPLATDAWLEVEARLVSQTRRNSPALRQISVRLNCPGEAQP